MGDLVKINYLDDGVYIANTTMYIDYGKSGGGNLLNPYDIIDVLNNSISVLRYRGKFKDKSEYSKYGYISIPEMDNLIKIDMKTFMELKEYKGDFMVVRLNNK